MADVKTGLLDRIEQLREEMTVAKEEVKRIEKEQRGMTTRIKDAFKLCCPDPVYKYTTEVKEPRRSTFDRIPEEVTETLRITRKLVNKEERQKCAEAHGQTLGKSEEDQGSVAYFRVNDVLQESHGGTLVLRQFAIVTDEEWDQIKDGNIPKHLEY
jgi:uncharacterized protein YrzB (UPF0473 family)